MSFFDLLTVFAYPMLSTFEDPHFFIEDISIAPITIESVPKRTIEFHLANLSNNLKAAFIVSAYSLSPAIIASIK